MSNRPGNFIWYELMTSDADVAARFYAAVVGWYIAPQADPQAAAAGRDYRMIGRSDGGQAGGVLQLTAGMMAAGAGSAWVSYLQVADVPATTRAIEADGGAVHVSMSLPVGDIAMVSDPMGTVFYVMRPVPPPGRPDAVSDVFDPKIVGRACWNELVSPDAARALAFYAKHFGFESNEKMPMGPMGDYHFIDHGGVRVGAIMQTHKDLPLKGWLTYFRVDSVAASKRAIETEGGRVLMGPHQVPGGDWIVVATDPQGAVFGVAGDKGE
jgi:predicted enzyme related to lactoylglutathione lyase